MLEQLSELEQFANAAKSQQAELIIWFLYEKANRERGISVNEIQKAFDALHLPRANPSRLAAYLKRSRNIRKVGTDYGPTLGLMNSLKGEIDFQPPIDDLLPNVDAITLPPFIDQPLSEHLRQMANVYAHIFLLENSMRGLVKHVLQEYLGPNWWDQCSNNTLKRKHEQRVKNEEAKKWAPTRSEFGPLYALDWMDLISIMRKYPDQFSVYIGEINFLHRFEDLGSFRNVLAHNGVLKDEDNYKLIQIYYQDWVRQVS